MAIVYILCKHSLKQSRVYSWKWKIETQGKDNIIKETEVCVQRARENGRELLSSEGRPHLESIAENRNSAHPARTRQKSVCRERENGRENSLLSFTSLIPDMMEAMEECDAAEVKDIKSYIQNGDLGSAFERIKDYLESLENVPLNIAVTGESGTGKSTFINTFLELSDEDAAKAGVVETTMEPKAYSHPKYKNVQYWDLPGTGTPNFKAEHYLDKVNFGSYDFFIIIASERFRECNIQLARAIQAMKKNFYFVRSKIGNDVSSSKKQRRKSFCEEKVLEEIKEDCLTCFRKANLGSPKVFLIDCFEKGKYDFDALQETMEKELPVSKKHVFLMSLPNISLAVLEKKREALRKQIWMKALLCCAAAAIPIPGLGRAYDNTIVERTMREYQSVFGLDEGSLNKLSQLSHKSVSELQSVMKCPQELDKNTNNMAPGAVAMGAVMVAKRLGYRIDILSTLAAGGVYGVYHYWKMCQKLRQSLYDSAEDAQRVLIKAWEDQV
ncbi:interferon-gamma-inducible GTPase 10-like [Dendropsophus ebraccatus]|uniref:interferon-gamma-inducible GTPase 10-like n=1 Tax=Dendropsophus ebraccatus TaxID=150705 RepID=UPI003831F126